MWVAGLVDVGAGGCDTCTNIISFRFRSSWIPSRYRQTYIYVWGTAELVQLLPGANSFYIWYTYLYLYSYIHLYLSIIIHLYVFDLYLHYAERLAYNDAKVFMPTASQTISFQVSVNPQQHPRDRIIHYNDNRKRWEAKLDKRQQLIRNEHLGVQKQPPQQIKVWFAPAAKR